MAIENVIVVMLENRSYDNILGYLYGPLNQPPYVAATGDQSALDGLPPDASNPGPGGPYKAHNQRSETSSAAGPPYAPTTIPLVDPGEYFSDMAQQLLGLPKTPTKPSPWKDYNPEHPGAATTGFVDNYSQIGGVLHPTQDRPPVSNYPDVMNYFTPAVAGDRLSRQQLLRLG